MLDLLYRYAELIDAGDFEGLGRLLDRAEFGGTGTATVSGLESIAGLVAMTTRRFDDGGIRPSANRTDPPLSASTRVYRVLGGRRPTPVSAPATTARGHGRMPNTWLIEKWRTTWRA